MQEEYVRSWEWNEVVEVTEKVLWVDSCRQVLAGTYMLTELPKEVLSLGWVHDGE